MNVIRLQGKGGSMPSLLFVLANLLVVVASLSAAELLFGRRQPARRFLAAVAGIPIIVYAVQMVLGNLGLLRIGPAVGCMAALAGLLALLAWCKAGKDEAAGADAPPARSAEEVVYGWLALGLLAGVAALAIASICFQGTAFVGDDVAYHAIAPAQWYQDQRLTLPACSYTAYYPMNAELFCLWFLLPLGCDGMAWMAGAYWTLLLAAAAFILVQGQGQKAHVAAMCTALVLASPVVLRQARSFTACDLSCPALIFAAAAMILPLRKLASGGGRLADAVYGGLLAGLAAGTKVTMAPLALVLLVAVALLSSRATPGRLRVLAVVLFTAALLLTGSYWYVRNIVLTGNPFYPAAVATWAGPFDAAAQRPTKLIYWLLGPGRSMKHIIPLAADFTEWPLGLFVLSAGGGLVAAFRLLRRKAADDFQRQHALVLCAIALVALAAHPFTPYSATANMPLGSDSPRILLRFLLVPFAAGMILAGPLLAAKQKHSALCWALGTLGIVTAFGYGAGIRPQLIGHYGPISFAAGAVVLAGFSLFRRAGAKIRWPKTAAVIAVAAFLAVETLLLPYHQRLTDARLLGNESAPSGVNGAWLALEKLPPGSRVLCVLHAWYPLFGRHFQFKVQPVLADGSPYRPLHEQWRAGMSWWQLLGMGRPPGLEQFTANVLKTGAPYLALFRQPATWDPPNQWLPQYRLLNESPSARLIFGDNVSALYRLDRQGR
jgi:hypothetical protein